MITTTAPWSHHVPKLWVAGLLLVVAMLNPVLLTAPKAAASCSLTNDEAAFVDLLAEKNIGPAPGTNYCDLASSGQVIANDARRGMPATTEASAVYHASNLTWEQAAWYVAASIVVFAPELVPSSGSEGGSSVE
jgi:Protein of unknown function (DUF732)